MIIHVNMPPYILEDPDIRSSLLKCPDMLFWPGDMPLPQIGNVVYMMYLDANDVPKQVILFANEIIFYPQGDYEATYPYVYLILSKNRPNR